MSKAPDAFRTISEVSEILETPPHVLRFWETKFSQLKPVKRAGGRRYYRPSDLELLGGIKRLLHDDGMTIRGVQKMLREKGVKHVAALSPPLGIDAEIEAPAAQPATPATSQPAPQGDTRDPAPLTGSGKAPDEGRAAAPAPPPASARRSPKVTDTTPPEDAAAPGLPFDPPPAAHAPADGPGPGDAAGDLPAAANTGDEALAARIRALSESESAPDPADAAPSAPPPAASGGSPRAPAPQAPEAARAGVAAEDADPLQPETSSAAAQSPSERDDDARPGIATLLRRLNGPLPPARAQALRPLSARLEALSARLAEADDAAPG